jgi:hypothetical protein
MNNRVVVVAVEDATVRFLPESFQRGTIVSFDHTDADIEGTESEIRMPKLLAGTGIFGSWCTGSREDVERNDRPTAGPVSRQAVTQRPAALPTSPTFSDTGSLI